MKGTGGRTKASNASAEEQMQNIKKQSLTVTAPATADKEVEGKNLFQRLRYANALLTGIKFEKTLSAQDGKGDAKFKTIPIDTMRAAIADTVVARAGVIIFPSTQTVVREGTGPVRTYIEQTFTYVNADDPDDSIQVQACGEAMDYGDKGTAKAQSNLLKNLYKTMHFLGDGNSDDSDAYADLPPQSPAVKAMERKASDDKGLRIDAEKRMASEKRSAPEAPPAPEAPAEEHGTVAQAVAHISIDGEPYPNGGVTNLGKDHTGGKPEADGRVHLRTVPAVMRQWVGMNLLNRGRTYLRPILEAQPEGKDAVRYWSQEDIEKAYAVLKAHGLKM